MISVPDAGLAGAGGNLCGFRGEFYRCLSGWPDALFELAALAGLPLPRAGDGRLVLAVDITCWLRPDVQTSAGRILCHTYGSCPRGERTHRPMRTNR